LTWFYVGLGGALFLMALGGVVSARFFRLNARLNQQILKRGEIETRLRESERQMSVLMSNLPGMAYRCRNDQDWTMLFVSQGCLNLTGYTPAELTEDHTIAYGDLIYPEDQLAVQNEVQAGVNEFRPFKMTYRIITKANEEKWVWEQGRAIYSPEGALNFLEGFIADVTEQKQFEEERETLIAQLQNSLKEIKVLRGIIPICASCKKIRDDQGFWQQVEVYIHEHSEADFSHGICPDCTVKLYPEIFGKKNP
jgi:PAS domain S-box-containing protein